MPKINFPATALSTITRAEIENLLAPVHYLLGGRIDGENILSVVDTIAPGNPERSIQIPTSKIVDFADNVNPVDDCMKLFGTDNLNPDTGVKSTLFEPLRKMLEGESSYGRILIPGNKVYVTDSVTVAWNLTKDSSTDKVKKEAIYQEKSINTSEITRKAASKLIAGSSNDRVLRLPVKRFYKRESSIYTKHAIFEKPRNWRPVPEVTNEDEINNVFDTYNNKIKYTVEFRADRMVNASYDEPPPYSIIINEPIVRDEEIDFTVDLVAGGLRENEYINIEIIITVLFEIVP